MAPLSDLPALEILWLYNSNLTDVSALSNLPRLRSLYLQSNNITDPSPLGSLPAVTVIELDDNRITDFSALTNLSTLAYFSLENNRISTIPDLSGLTALLNIGLEHNAVTDLTPLLTASDTVVWFKLEENFIDTASAETRAVEGELRRRGAALILRDQRPLPVFPIPVLDITHDPRTPATISISFRVEPGANYQLRFSEDLKRWQSVATPVAGNGSKVELSLPRPAARKGFFTVLATPLP